MKAMRDILLERGYSTQAADVTANKLVSLSGIFAKARDNWLENSSETDIESHGYSISELMKRFKGMTYPAALLTIEWLNREPEKAKHIIEKGIK